MKPENGNWSLLTHRRDRGGVWVMSWSLDGALIYYDRNMDVPLGIYSMPVLGGEERLVLANASAPASLPDGSMLVVKINRDGNPQYYRYWKDTGRVLELPLLALDNQHISGTSREFCRAGRKRSLWGSRPAKTRHPGSSP